MNRIISTLVLTFVALTANAQYYTTLNREAAIRLFNRPMERREIILPTIDGYTLYKADFHTHTIYSDGDVTPRQRVREAWYDGLDIVAITDHLEIRTYEKFMLKVLAPYNRTQALPTKRIKIPLCLPTSTLLMMRRYIIPSERIFR